jgi:hypothetical protein
MRHVWRAPRPVCLTIACVIDAEQSELDGRYDAFIRYLQLDPRLLGAFGGAERTRTPSHDLSLSATTSREYEPAARR